MKQRPAGSSAPFARYFCHSCKETMACKGQPSRCVNGCAGRWCVKIK